ncbi:HNH endonuclease [Paenibacillus selenitireducens]|uniref:Putative HNH nuclease YajD n=1 Tax=Paenibacillus selenitireducens TaxID=1324314 RepID=A0A1T2XCC7_9BACL|nr:HNH endonuclease signature motif containing protein [Paenibacillus selenitireducens]OPA77500.1 HNH endonuclease [Paenibacillus selenitireducens]
MVKRLPPIAQKPCSHTGCRILTRERYCSAHTKDKNKYDRYRGTASQRGYNSKWRQARVWYLVKHPLCVYCAMQDKVIAATVVDHIKPHKGDKLLFWDRDNWQGLCISCHNSKTVREDGGFGNTQKC